MFLGMCFVTNFTFNGSKEKNSSTKPFIKIKKFCPLHGLCYVFLYIIFRPFIIIEAIKTETLPIKYTHL